MTWINGALLLLTITAGIAAISGIGVWICWFIWDWVKDDNDYFK